MPSPMMVLEILGVVVAFAGAPKEWPRPPMPSPPWANEAARGDWFALLLA